MFSHEDLKLIAEQAKKDLKEQESKQEESAAPVDLYAEFREELAPASLSFDVPQEEVSLSDIGMEEMFQAPISLFDAPEEIADTSLDELVIFPGGPTSSQVDIWKKEWEGHDILAVQVQNDYFVIRSLNRLEYKRLVSMENVDSLMREEIICTNCVLFPMGYEFKEVAVARAGIPSTLAQVIMEASGFTNEYQIQVL